ncbi:MAG: hypothetical protein WBA74_17545, partial [Cyclobacteriaceae bacterium]
VYLMITFGFGVEYILLMTQATLVITYLYRYKKLRGGKELKYKNEFSLFVAVLLMGIVYYATLHILVIVLSSLVVAGWFTLIARETKN